MKLRFIVGFCLLFVAVATGTAQRQDVRLSPEPLITALPSNIRIQSAATVGSITLAVWGTVVANGDSSVRNVLWSQIIHGTKPMQGKALTGITANPTDMVSVFGLRDRFLVAWNEKGSGVHLCIIDTNGNVLIPAKQADKIAGISDNLIWLLYRESGYLLVYKNYNAGHGLETVSLNNDGSIATASQAVFTEGVNDVIVNSHTPNLAIIRTNIGGRVLYADGTLDERIIPAERLSAMPTIQPDSSLYCIIKDTLYKFKHYFDTTPEWRRRVLLVDVISNAYVITPNSEDSSINIIYAAHTTTPIDSKSYADEVRQYHINLTDDNDTTTTLLLRESSQE